MLIHAQKGHGALLFLEIPVGAQHRAFPSFETRSLHNKTTGCSQFLATARLEDFPIPLSK
jgi:hypothetical protein